ncbi:MAG: hypothetical protein ABI665_15645 [Vicinamibacterales bacterium]
MTSSATPPRGATSMAEKGVNSTKACRRRSMMPRRNWNIRAPGR